MEDKVFILELAKALKEKRNVVFIFIGPDGSSIRCAIKDGNILYIESLYGTGKSEIERLIKWKKGKVIERPLKTEDENKKGELIDPNPIIALLEKVEEKEDLKSEFKREFLKLLKYLVNDLETYSQTLKELQNFNKSTNIYYIQNKGFLFLKDDKVEGFLNNIGKFLSEFFSSENLIISKLSIEGWEYELMKLPFYKEPEIEGKISISLINRFLNDVNGLFYISEKSKMILLKNQNNLKIYKTSPEISILDNLELKEDPSVLIYT
ncbi:MAG: hypothetical protein ABIL24_03955 [candidate division WOR-3 bacterium]